MRYEGSVYYKHGPDAGGEPVGRIEIDTSIGACKIKIFPGRGRKYQFRINREIKKVRKIFSGCAHGLDGLGQFDAGDVVVGELFQVR
jgi:hypothetical protein